MIKSFAHSAIDFCVKAVFCGIAARFFFGIFGVVTWTSDGDASRIIGLGWFGLVFYAVLVLGYTIVESVNSAATSSPRGPTSNVDEQEVIAAFVWPIANASPDDLQLLGNQLRSWLIEYATVIRIDGLDALLSGEYPVPSRPLPPVNSHGYDGIEWPVPSLDGRPMYIPEPWRYCPAIVWSKDGTSNDVMNVAMKCLERAVPSSIGSVEYPIG